MAQSSFVASAGATWFSARGLTGRLGGPLPAFIPTTRHVVALTFDAGANDAGVPSILRTLLRFHVAATFFLTGHFARTYPVLARTCSCTSAPARTAPPSTPTRCPR